MKKNGFIIISLSLLFTLFFITTLIACGFFDPMDVDITLIKLIFDKPLAFLISGGNNLSVTAVTSEPVDKYEWYISNTKQGETSDTITLSSGLAVGDYILTCEVYKDYRSASFSDSFSVYAASPIPGGNLILYLPFNGNADDESGNGVGTTVNGAILSSDRNGKANNAYYFDGDNDYIETNSDLQIDDFPFSFSCWLYMEDVALATASIISTDIYDSWMADYYGFRIFTDNRLGATIGGGHGSGEQRLFITSGGTFPHYKWKHICVVFTSYNEVHLYIDGVEFEAILHEYNGDQLATTAANDRIGNDYDDQNRFYFKGLLDEARFYTATLSIDDVFNIYYYEKYLQ